MAHNGYNYDSSAMGNKYAKAMADSVLWYASTNTGAVGNTDYPTYRNKSGFSGLPAGWRHENSTYYARTYTGKWWTFTQDSPTDSWKREMHYTWNTQLRSSTNNGNGFSIRCLRD